MITETSFLTFSPGGEATKKNTGSRGLLGGVVCELDGLAPAKQILLPPGTAAYAPHSPYCPSSVGSAPSRATACGAGFEALGLAAGFAGFGLAGAPAGGAARAGGCFAGGQRAAWRAPASGPLCPV